ncbi:MAG: hypothetical protein JW884_10175 [Deltaproteobacteria bacterium]|nr:hypothetical protein [Deltaproteobacteria bacterium]
MSRNIRLFFHFFLSPERLLIGSFAAIIVAGTALLMLPLSTSDGRIAFIDALFTATSAVCVTGLTVMDTGASFSTVGQVIILLLIQAGGLGIVTFSLLIYHALGFPMPLRGKLALESTFSHEPVRDIYVIVKSVFFYTMIIEAVGALSYFMRWVNDFSPGRALYISIFHAVSAFCNAGFSTFSDSFMGYAQDWWINGTTIVLIVTGGIGFMVISDLTAKLCHRTRLSLHTKIVLFSTAALIAAGALIVLLTEWSNALSGRPLPEKILIGLFQSVAARTAGFNTVDIGLLSNATLFIMIVLMFVGASPGSCGGGIKTTNMAILLSLAYNRFKGSMNAVMFRRMVPYDTVIRSISLLIGSLLFLILVLSVFLIFEESGISHNVSKGLFLETVFELTSAFGTVGLSTGITSNLDALGKTIVIVTMFTGRIGLLTLTYALARREVESKILYGEENVLVG